MRHAPWRIPPNFEIHWKKQIYISGFLLQSQFINRWKTKRRNTYSFIKEKQIFRQRWTDKKVSNYVLAWLCDCWHFYPVNNFIFGEPPQNYEIVVSFTYPLDFHGVLRQVENDVWDRDPKFRGIKCPKHVRFTFCFSHFRTTRLC